MQLEPAYCETVPRPNYFTGCPEDEAVGTEGNPAQSEAAPTDASGYTDPSEPIVEPDAGAGADPVHQPVCTSLDCVSANGTRRSAGYQYAYLEDPVGINVTELTSYLGWTYNPRGCVVPGSRNSYANDDWYEQSGWGKVSSNTTGGSNCARAYTSTYAQYRNPVFCRIVLGVVFGSATRSIYDRNVVKGFSNYPGSLVGETRHMKKGGCASLLSFRQRTVRQY